MRTRKNKTISAIEACGRYLYCLRNKERKKERNEQKINKLNNINCRWSGVNLNKSYFVDFCSVYTVNELNKGIKAKQKKKKKKIIRRKMG